VGDAPLGLWARPDFGGDEVDHIAALGRLLRLLEMKFRVSGLEGSGSLEAGRREPIALL